MSHGFVRTSGVSGCAWVQSSATIGYSVIELVSICYINRNWTIYQNSKRKKRLKATELNYLSERNNSLSFFCLTTSDHQLCPITLNNPFFVIHTINHHSISLKVSNLRQVIILQIKFQRKFCCSTVMYYILVHSDGVQAKIAQIQILKIIWSQLVNLFHYYISIEGKCVKFYPLLAWYEIICDKISKHTCRSTSACHSGPTGYAVICFRTRWPWSNKVKYIVKF